MSDNRKYGLDTIASELRSIAEQKRLEGDTSSYEKYMDMHRSTKQALTELRSVKLNLTLLESSREIVHDL